METQRRGIAERNEHNTSRRVGRPPKRETAEATQQQTESVEERGARAHVSRERLSGCGPEGGNDQVRARATIDDELMINAELGMI